MISPEELRLKAQRLYPRYLREKVSGSLDFPWVIPANKSVPERFDVFQKSLHQLLEASKNRCGSGYTVELRETQTRQHGKQQLPSRIFFESEADFLAFLDKTAEVALFERHVALLLGHFPGLKGWVSAFPAVVIEQAEYWDALIQVLYAYVANPRPGLYLREMSLALPTKFIEGHLPVLDSLLTHLCPSALNAGGGDFQERWGFKNKPRHFFRLRLLDKVPELLGIQALSLDIAQLQAVKLPCRRVLIVENEMTFLTLPPLSETVAIWGHGNQAQLLSQVSWLHDREISYWGDLDTYGLRILAGLRRSFPALHALWMDQATLERYRPLLNTASPDPHPVPVGLSEAEQALFVYLQTYRLRLEQEQIAQADVVKGLRTAFNVLSC